MVVQILPNFLGLSACNIASWLACYLGVLDTQRETVHRREVRTRLLSM